MGADNCAKVAEGSEVSEIRLDVQPPDRANATRVVAEGAAPLKVIVGLESSPMVAGEIDEILLAVKLNPGVVC